MNKNPPQSAFFRLILLSMLLALCLAVPIHAELDWDIHVVDENASGIGNGYCPIVVDTDNNSHIAYSGAPKMRYASWNGSGWDIQLIEYTRAHDLALDTDGNPHITFGSLAYARWTGTDWNIQAVTTNHTVYSSLALDSAGNPHVAYITGKKLQYASQNGSNWNIQTIDTLPEINYEVSLAIDSNNTPYVMYYTPSSYIDSSIGGARFVNVKLAVWKNSSWNIETVLPSINLSGFGNMVLDSNDHPHFLATQRRYLSAETPRLLSDILHVSWDGVAWNTETVALNVTLNNIGFLSLGPDDYPHIVYKSGQLMYARWTGKTWETQNVTKTRLTSGLRVLYLAVDSEGNPHISYREDPTFTPFDIRKLMYATATLPTPTATPTHEPQQTNQTETITGLAITVAVVGAGLGFLLYLIKKR